MPLNGANILVTGGAGFIGSHIVEDLLSAGANVTVYDNFSFGHRENLEAVEGRVKIVTGDILDRARLSEAIRGMDYVSHHAAQLEIFLSTDNPRADLETNTVGTLNVLDACAKAGVGKLVNASSACVYGQAVGPTSERDMPVPNWAYGVSKLAAERYATIYNDYRSLPVVSLRYGIVYGEREWYRRVLTIFVKRAILDQPLVVFGDGKQVRDFVNVADVVRLNRFCMECDEANGQVYNAGTGVATTIAHLAHTVAQVSGKRLEVVYEDCREGELSALVAGKKRNAAELKSMLLDCGKAERELGWKPAVALDNGIAGEMAWASQHLDRWEKIRYTPLEAD